MNANEFIINKINDSIVIEDEDHLFWITSPRIIRQKKLSRILNLKLVFDKDLHDVEIILMYDVKSKTLELDYNKITYYLLYEYKLLNDNLNKILHEVFNVKNILKFQFLNRIKFSNKIKIVEYNILK